MSSSPIIVIDANNILFRAFVVHKDPNVVGLGLHVFFNMIENISRKFHHSAIVLAFDSGKTTWRKLVSKDGDLNPLRVPYKGNRKQSLSEKDLLFFENYYKLLETTYEFFDQYTAIPTIKHSIAEGDDVIFSIVKRFHQERKIVVYTNDNDMLQLLRFSNVLIFDPGTNQPKNLNKFQGDVEYMLFEKFFRGDRSDNILSAYPRLRKTKIQAAYKNPEFLLELLNTTWEHGIVGTVRVGDVFNYNKLMIDFKMIPDCVISQIDQVVDEKFTEEKAPDYSAFLRLCGKFQLNEAAKSDMLFDLLCKPSNVLKG